MTIPTLIRVFTSIANGERPLESPSSIQVGAFFYGYLLIVPGLAWLNEALDEVFSGPTQARSWTRAYLSLGEKVGAARVINEAITLLENSDRLVEGFVDTRPEWFVEVVVESLSKGRPATVLGECTISWLYNFGLGAQLATEAHFPEIAQDRANRFAVFESWIQDYYELPGVPWQRILRGIEGPGERAVYRFGDLWNEHNKEPL